MAKNDDRDRQSKSYSGLHLRETARSRPIATAAVATAAAAAGAYFLSRRSGGEIDSRPLMNWGRNREAQNQDSSSPPSATAGTSTGDSVGKPARNRGGSASRSSNTGSQTSRTRGNTGLDQTSQSQMEVGSTSYSGA